jgi:hypothetical protein
MRGSSPGLSGWTYDHLRAATGTSPTVTTAILALTNLIIGGCLPDIPSLHASAFIALVKPGGRGVLSPSARCGFALRASVRWPPARMLVRPPCIRGRRH